VVRGGRYAARVIVATGCHVLHLTALSCVLPAATAQDERPCGTVAFILSTRYSRVDVAQVSMPCCSVPAADDALSDVEHLLLLAAAADMPC
jgi:hypothetical protein